MKHFSQYLATAGFVAIAVQSSVALGQSLADAVAVPPVPGEIKVPDGNVAYLKGQATGTQNYICLPAPPPAPNGVAWKLFGPQANLYLKFKLFNIEIVQQITTHFLSPNPEEAGLARATWQSSLDTSAVWAKMIKSSTDSSFVAAGAIPWFLLENVGDQRGPTGGAMLTPTTYIHRVNTSGGAPPATGCGAAANIGATALVPYTADYYFYKSGR